MSSRSSSSPSSPENTSVEVITLDASFEVKEENGNDSVPNLAESTTTTTMDTTVVQFDATLPPGAAPEGFVIVDEEMDVTSIEEKKVERAEKAESAEKKSEERSDVRKSEKRSAVTKSEERSEVKKNDEKSEVKSEERSIVKKSEERSEVKKSEERREVKKSEERSEEKKREERSEERKREERSEAKKSEERSEAKPQPIFKVVFRDGSAFRNYHKKIERYLRELISSKSDKKSVTSTTTDLVLEVFDPVRTYKHSSDVDSPKEKFEEKHSNDTLFTVDIVPKKIQDDLDIPMYGKKFNTALQKNNDEIGEVKEDTGPRMTCFNCLGNHSLRDCDQPRNYAVINKNRKDYAAKRGPSSSRYHLDEDQKFGHLVPGKVSANLRKALGIKDQELPRHIYRMRILGYPPGWLEEARLQHSGLTLFNDDGNAEQGSDEEGEIVAPGDKDQYDIKKLIDFPGFNIVTPQGTRDECNEYWGSSEQMQCSKRSMVSCLSHKKVDDGYKRRKMPNSANMLVRTDVNPGEMDIDEIEDISVECLPIKHLFIPPLPKENIPEPPPPPPPVPGMEDSDSLSQEDMSINSNDESTAPSSRDDSPSLFDLESKHKELLAELDNPNSPSNRDSAKTGASNLDSSVTGTPDVDSSKKEESEKNKININNVTPKNSPKPPSIFGSGRKAVKETHLGTPILQSASPFRSLPCPEKFSKDICDVINFENLPDSTGKYDQMAELLQKVRTTVSDLQKE